VTGKKLDTDIPDIATAKEGFWTDEYYNYTTGSDNVWWISPASVICVKKEYRTTL
jgi:hypothetical protein